MIVAKPGRDSIYRQRGAVATFAQLAATHELAGSLGAIRAAVEVALKAEAGWQADGFLKDAHAELGRLAQVVETLLLLDGAGSAPRSPICLDEVVRSGVRACELIGGEARIMLSIGLSSGLVLANGIHLETALGNLVRNALLHSPSGSTVKVRVNGTGGHEMISITNVRLSESEGGPSRRGGHGIGMTIAQHFIELNGGEMLVSATPAAWATFVRFPLMNPQTRAAHEMAQGSGHV